jgi:hypothetical protein
MNTAVRDVQQSKQQFVVFLGLFARSAAPARLAAIVFAIAAFFAAGGRIVVGNIRMNLWLMLLAASAILLMPRCRRLQLARARGR